MSYYLLTTLKKKDIPFLACELEKMFPNAKTELEHENEFQLLIAILLSAQTTDKQVNKASKNFFQVLKTPDDWINLWVEEIKKYIKTLWFYNNKAKNIYKTSKILVEKFDSKIPKTFEELIELPWVWVKTAKVFLAITQDAPYIWVDTHVHRVLNRLWLVKTKSPLETDKVISSGFTKENHKLLHHTLVLFWRYYCTARNPKCENCVFKEKCDYFKEKYWK